MHAFVKAMYCGTVKLQHVEFALKVMLAAEKFNVTLIENACSYYIGENLTADNVLKSLVVADTLEVYSLNNV